MEATRWLLEDEMSLPQTDAKSTHLRGGVLHQFYVNQQSKKAHPGGRKREKVSSLQLGIIPKAIVGLG